MSNLEVVEWDTLVLCDKWDLQRWFLILVHGVWIFGIASLNLVHMEIKSLLVFELMWLYISGRWNWLVAKNPNPYKQQIAPLFALTTYLKMTHTRYVLERPRYNSIKDVSTLYSRTYGWVVSCHFTNLTSTITSQKALHSIAPRNCTFDSTLIYKPFGFLDSKRNFISSITSKLPTRIFFVKCIFKNKKLL